MVDVSIPIGGDAGAGGARALLRLDASFTSTAAIAAIPSRCLLLVATANPSDAESYIPASRFAGVVEALTPAGARAPYGLRLRLLRDDETLGAAVAARRPRTPPLVIAVADDFIARLLRARFPGSAPPSAARMMYDEDVGRRSSAGAPAPPPFSVATLRALAALENAARLSPPFQTLFGEIEREYSAFPAFGIPDWMEACSELQFELVWRALAAGWGQQRSVEEAAAAPLPRLDADPVTLAAAVRHAIGETRSGACAAQLAAAEGVAASTVIAGVQQLRLGGHTDPLIREASLYWKYNRVARGALRAGDAAPDVTLTPLLLGGPRSLHELVAAAWPRPLVVVGGSYS